MSRADDRRKLKEAHEFGQRTAEENARLRAALERIATVAATKGTPQGDRLILDGIARRANEALGAKS